MRDFIEELMYMCKSSKIRGFYIMLTIFMCLLIVGILASVVLMIVTAAKGAFIWYTPIITLVMLGILVGIIIWLKKS